MSTFDHETSDVNYQAAIERQEHALFALLKPSMKKDGDRWCVLYGDNLQEGVAGFGASPNKAIQAFNLAWYEEIEPPHDREIFPGTKDALSKISIRQD